MMKKEDTSESIKKSKSTCDIPDAVLSNAAAYTKKKGNFRGNRRLSRTFSDSSLEIMAMDSDSEERPQLADSGVADQSASDSQTLLVLEQKIDRLNDLFQEQCRLLTTLKEDIRNSKAAMEKVEQHQTDDAMAEFVNNAVYQSRVKETDDADAILESNSRARSLLNAIEIRQGSAADREFKDALANFLQSDELKEHMVSATAESVRGVIGECISRDLSSLYLPMLEHSHRRLVRQLTRTIEDAFTELEENSACLSRSVYKMSRSLRRAMERHQHLLAAAARPRHNLEAAFQCTVEEMLHNEVKQWRQKVLAVFTDAPPQPEDPPEQMPPSVPPSPPQLDNHSVVEQLMMVAKINSEIEAGDVNAAFERALNAADLALVTAACRRGAAAFAPRCRLRQDVLLALLQQLSTDMLHDTQLKCRFLEDSIINLDVNDPVTRTHLPLIVGEVRKHLSRFLAACPGHVASRRIALIVMAADNLLK